MGYEVDVQGIESTHGFGGGEGVTREARLSKEQALDFSSKVANQHCPRSLLPTSEDGEEARTTHADGRAAGFLRANVQAPVGAHEAKVESAPGYARPRLLRVADPARAAKVEREEDLVSDFEARDALAELRDADYKICAGGLRL